MTRLYYAFHYTDGLNTTYASTPRKTAGDVVAYASSSLRDSACNTFEHSFMDFNQQRRAIRAVTVKEIRSMGHGRALDTSTNEGAAIAAHVHGTDIQALANRDQ